MAVEVEEEKITFSLDGTGTLKRGAFSNFDLVLSDVKSRWRYVVN